MLCSLECGHSEDLWMDSVVFIVETCGWIVLCLYTEFYINILKESCASSWTITKNPSL